MTRTDWVQAIDNSLLLVGAGLGLVWAVVYLRRFGLRNPLAGLRPPQAGPTLIHLILIVLTLLLLTGTASTLTAATFPNGLDQPGTSAWHVLQAAQGLASLVVALLCAWILHQSPITAPGDSSEKDLHPPQMPRVKAAPPWLSSAAAIITTLAITPLCLALWSVAHSVWSRLSPDQPHPDHPILLALHGSAWGAWGIVLLVLGAVVVAPLFEELLFRGVLLQALWSAAGRAWPAILISAAAFGLLHGARPADVPPLVVLGVAFGLLRLSTGSLAACVLAHALFNGRTIALALLAPELIRGT